MTTTKSEKTYTPYRSEAPFLLTDAEPETLRKIYAADEWNGVPDARELLEGGYRNAKAPLRREVKQLFPDTFKELLDKEEGSTFPTYIYFETLRNANYIYDDTETARDIIEHIEKGSAAKVRRTPPRRIFEADLEETPEEVASLILGKEIGSSFQKRLAETWLEAEAFTYPSGRPVGMIKNAKTKASREKLAAAFRPAIEEEYRAAAQAVADETGAKLADVLNPKKRTAEQYKRLLTATREIITARLDTIYRSNFVCALIEILYTGDQPETKLSSATAQIIARYAALYFFALHPEIDLRAADALKDTDLKEVKEIHGRLLPFMEKAMKEAHKKKEFLGAWQAFVKFIEAENPEEEDQDQIKEIVNVTARETEKAALFVDKLSAHAFRDPLFRNPSIGENMQLALGFEDYRADLPAVNMAKSDSEKKAPVVWGIRFDFSSLPEGVKITKQLDEYDEHVYYAAYALYRAGLEVVSLNTIYKAMGRRGNPSKDDRKKINASLSKMRSAIVYIDNSEEITVNKKSAHFHYDGSLLPFERVSAVYNGNEIKTAIRLLDEPPLGRFARGRNQALEIPLSVWGFPLSLTNTRLGVAHYLARHIAQLKHPKSRLNKKLTFETIFKECRATTRMQKSRCRKIVEELIGYWRDDCNPAFIGKNTRIEKDCVMFDIKKK